MKTDHYLQWYKDDRTFKVNRCLDNPVQVNPGEVKDKFLRFSTKV